MVTVGCVPYVNAIPLVAKFEDWGDRSPVRVVYNVPSRLPALLEGGAADAILVSSVDALRVPGRRMAEGVCIGSYGPVKSVRLFSRVAPDLIRSLALDASSMTSNRLAQIVLAERHGVRPEVRTLPPDLDAMLAECDACVLIGDLGMTASGEGLHVLDLGEEWRLLTGKPFVWAAWIGGDRLTPELARWLATAAQAASVGRRLSIVPSRADAAPTEQANTIRTAIERSGWSRERVEDYFLNVMVYDLDESMIDGLREFQRRLLANGFDDCRHFPTLVAAADTP